MHLLTIFLGNLFQLNKILNMKNITFLLLFQLSIILNLYADTYTVSNVSDSPGEYTEIQTAVDAANPYDTILVSASSSTYAGALIDKPLVLIGEGYFGDEDATTKVDWFVLKSGNILSPSNSKISGFEISGMSGVEIWDFNLPVNNVVLENNKLAKIKFYGGGVYSNDTIRNCYFENATLYFGLATYTSIAIHNNVLDNSVIGSLTSADNSEFFINHNLFMNQTGSYAKVFDQINGSIIENNIFFAANPKLCTDCIFNNNISYLCDDNTLPGTGNTGSNNLESTDPQFVNLDWDSAPAFSYDSDYHLSSGSPGENAATDGTNIGMYGGTHPFNVGAKPDVPKIISLSITTNIGYYEPIVANIEAEHSENIVAIEYFVDDDTGVNTGSIIQTTPGTQLSLTETFDVSAASTGSHYIYVRALDLNGKWGHWKRETFTKEIRTLDIDASAMSVSCYGECDGSIEVGINSGNGNYEYAWTDENYNDIGQSTQIVSNLCAGIYKVTVTDGMANVDSATVEVYSPDEIVINLTYNNDSCYQGEASAFASVTGTVQITYYEWSTGSTDASISGLYPGNYSVTVSDMGICPVTKSFTISGPASALDLSITSIASDCAASTGGATASVSGGTSPYEYLWSNTVTQASITYQPSGTYSVTVTDNNGCTEVGIAAISDDGAPVIDITSVSNVLCYGQSGGAIDVTVTDGEEPYAFEWSNGETSEDLSSASAGNYELVVVDNAGCSGAASITIEQPDPLNLSFSANNASCGNSDGSAAVTVTGGTAPYSYIWSEGSTNQNIDNVAAGVFELTVTDNNGCIAEDAIAVSEDGAAIISVDNIEEGNCGSNNASIDITVTGETQPYTYNWSNGATTEDLNNVSPGTYSVTVTHSGNSCQAIQSITIPAILPATPQICIITVDTTLNKNLIVWEKTGMTGIEYFNIYRESSVAGDYELIGSVDFSEVSIFVDQNSYPNTRSYMYKLSAIDSCGTESLLSSYHKTLLLGVNPQLPTGYYLDWQASYEGFAVQSYEIWRGNNTGELELIETISSNNTSYIDENPPTGTLFYRVAAVKPGNPCDPDGNKAQGGPYTQSFSNLEDNGIASIDQLSYSQEIKVIPNPNKGIFSLEVPWNGEKTIEIFNSEGKRVYHENHFKNSISNINIAKFGKGIYMIKTSNSQQIHTNKIIIQ
ncbi:MAG: hypothetical protein C0594_16320 [Marinilabiliales bacterium]|nr:MAG: hypothetical protein C0594_16320 [Marinilabiliales bacterium]